MSVRRVHALIGAALAQAERWDMVERNVARRARPPEVHSAVIRVPTGDQVRVILAEADRREPALAVLLFLGAALGARRGELCALRWSDIDWAGSAITIARSVYETKGGGWAIKATKTHQERTVALDDYSLSVLRRYKAQVDELASGLGLQVRTDGFICSRSPEGTEPIRPDVVSKFTSNVAKAVGVDTHVHSLRHFSATQLIAGGQDVRTVAGRLGHADASVTLRVYAHVLPERDREAAALIGRVLQPPPVGRPA